MDHALVTAWYGGDVAKIRPLLADDVYAYLGELPPTAQKGKRAFLERASRNAFSGRLDFSNPVVRIFGAGQDVAIACGIVTDDAKAGDKGSNYTCVYVEEAGSWKLVRFQLSPNGVNNLPVFDPSMAFTQNLPGEEALTPDGVEVAERMRTFLDALCRRNYAIYEKIIADNLIYFHGETGNSLRATQTSKREYIDGKYFNRSGPEVAVLWYPRVTLYGKGSDVAVLNVCRADATGGAAYFLYTPHWRIPNELLAVWTRSGPGKDDWKLVHLHGSPMRAAVVRTQ